MSRFKKISKKGFTKEVAMAALLFCLPVLILLHLLFDDDSAATLDIFGFRWTHGFVSDEVFSWIALTTFLSLVYLFLFYQSSKGLVKLVIQPFIWYLFYNFLSSFFPSIPEFFDQPHVVLVTLSGVIVWWIMQVLRGGISDSNQYHSTSLSKNVICALIIVLAFFIRVSNEFIPKTWLEVDLGFMVVGSFGFPSFELFLWGLGFKLGLLLPLIAWFFYEKKWWHYALLSPILVTVYQIRSIFNTETHIMDQYEILQALPLLTLIGLLLIALSKNAKDQYIGSTIYEGTKRRIEKMVLHQSQKEADDIEEVKRMFHKLKGERSTTEIDALKSLKKTLENKLRNT
ncbi:hypothetical protein MTsPCn5_06930 [Croceitalea sp. MTPC5]|uniref:hypothetical protein n=1 Tax=Croceitalea sp. MTPC5 TaxID=3056565 RepID=UPI002B3B407F|nr:hypothetical protein MTsPCn5_06930 [Croceitalea sp. MTPC5]